jgi:hypothetical protein
MTIETFNPRCPDRERAQEMEARIPTKKTLRPSWSRKATFCDLNHR